MTCELIEIPEQARQYLPLKEGEGLVITYVKAGSSAAKAGLREKDILAVINGQPVTWESLKKLYKNGNAGENVTVNIIRTGRTQEILLTLGI